MMRAQTVLLSLALLFTASIQAEHRFEWPVCNQVPFPPIPVENEVPTYCREHARRRRPYAVVVPAVSAPANLSWIKNDLDTMDHIVYQNVDPYQPHYYHQGGHEAGAYLQFIIDYYDCLPEAVAFIHGHDTAWHSCSMDETLKHLNWSAIPGYAGLNRRPDEVWEFNMKGRTFRPNDDSIEASGAEVYSGEHPHGKIIEGKVYNKFAVHVGINQAYYNVRAYDQFFGRAGLGPMPDVIKYMCCSQFTVTRDAIHFRSREFYIQALHFLRHNELINGAVHPADYLMGDIFTLYWQMIFGKPSDWSLYDVTTDDVLFPGASKC